MGVLHAARMVANFAVQEGGHRVSHLGIPWTLHNADPAAGAVLAPELKPIGKRLQSSHFPDRQDPRFRIVEDVVRLRC
jgi:hypothetical protein